MAPSTAGVEGTIQSSAFMSSLEFRGRSSFPRLLVVLLKSFKSIRSSLTNDRRNHPDIAVTTTLLGGDINSFNSANIPPPEIADADEPDEPDVDDDHDDGDDDSGAFILLSPPAAAPTSTPSSISKSSALGGARGRREDCFGLPIPNLASHEGGDEEADGKERRSKSATRPRREARTISRRKSVSVWNLPSGLSSR